MARRSENVELVDQKGGHLRWLARSEAAKMTRTGEATHSCRHCSTLDERDKLCQGRVKSHQMVYVAAPLYRETHVDPCAITARELMANSGVIGSEFYQRRARIKVKYWDPAAMRRELLVCV